MLEVSFEQRVATVASSDVGQNRTAVSVLPQARVRPSGLNVHQRRLRAWIDHAHVIQRAATTSRKHQRKRVALGPIR